jgi:hypothetical protein
VPDGWVKVPNSIARNGALTPCDKAVYLAIASHINGDGCWTMTITQLAAEAGCNVKRARASLQHLASAVGLQYEQPIRSRGYRFSLASREGTGQIDPSHGSDLPVTRVKLTRPDDVTETTRAELTHHTGQIDPSHGSDLPVTRVKLTRASVEEPVDPIEDPIEDPVGPPPKRRRPRRLAALPSDFVDRVAHRYPHWSRDQLNDEIAEAENYYRPRYEAGEYANYELCITGSLNRKYKREQHGAITNNHRPAPASGAGRARPSARPGSIADFEALQARLGQGGSAP